ncbi:OmpA family protein [bacterium]|nr:OmpA family protein [bacterium]
MAGATQKYLNGFVLILLLILSLSGSGSGITPPGTIIHNRAIFSYRESGTTISDTVSSNQVTIIILSSYEAEIEIRATLDSLCPEDDTLRIVYPGDTVNYFILFSNTGNDTLFEISLSDTLSPFSAFWSALPATYDSLIPVRWTIESLPPASADTYLVTAVIDPGLLAGTEIINISTLWSSELDTVYADTSILEVGEVHSVRLFKDFVFTEDFAGSRTIFQLIIQNNGNLEETGIEMVDSLPSGITLAYATSGIYTQFVDSLSNGGVLSWVTPSLPVLATDTIQVTVDLGTQRCNHLIWNTAYLWGESVDTISAQDSFYVKCTPLVNFSKVAERNLIYAGDSLYYQIIIENYGDSLETDFLVTDSLPILLEFIEGEGNYDILVNALSWQVDTLMPGVPETLTFIGYVPDTLEPGHYEMLNWAYLFWQTEDDNSILVTAAVETVQVIVPFLKLTKHAMKTEAEVGDIVTYVLTVKNESSGDILENVRIYDKLPVGFKHLSGASFLMDKEFADPYRDGGTLIWDLGPMMPDTFLVLAYQTVLGWGAEDGDGWNEAYAVASLGQKYLVQSPTVKAHVIVKKGLFEGGEMILGKIFIDNNKNGFQDFDEEGVGDITLYTEDGVRIVTDQDGKYSIPEVEPGTHVLRMDEETIPEQLTPFLISSQQAMDPYSSFVDVPKYGFARCNFALTYSKHFVRKEAYLLPKIFSDKNVEPNSVNLESGTVEGLDTLATIYFESGSVSLTPKARTLLDQVARTLNGLVGLMIIVEGHSDNIPMRPGARYKNNDELSQGRALAVENYLLKNTQLKYENFEVIYWGDSRPASTNSTPQGRAINRRVSIITQNLPKQVPKSDSQEIKFTINFIYTGKQTIKNIIIEESFVGLEYIPNSATAGNRKVTDMVTAKGVTWQLIGYKGPLEIELEYQARLKGLYFNTAPRTFSNIRIEFVSGEVLDYQLSKAVGINYTTPYNQVRIDDASAPPAIYSKLLRDAFEKQQSSFSVNKGDEILYKITVNVTGMGYYNQVRVYDEVIKPILFVQGSGLVDGSIYQNPSFEENKLVWDFPPRSAPFTVTVEYRAIAKTNFQEKNPTGNVWLKLETSSY